MGSTSSKFRKHLQSGDEVQALQLYRTNSELRKALDPNCSYGDSHQHETPLHLAAKHGMQTLLGIFLFSKGGNPNKTNARKETCLHCVCMESNSQSVHVCKRRAECLNYLLKWRGAMLAEGQMEKVDLAAQDEKLNTALHYAAASGLEQCVEILIQHGAPLFLENEDNLTPCDTAERNSHSRIALYLESKMVFSNEEEPQGEADDVSMPPVEEYSGLRPQDLQEAKDQLLVETADMLSVPLFTAEALLRNHEWSRETLLEAWMTDPVACCEKCGVTPPSTLFSEKPEVQENLHSPLPSPLHSAPTPLDAECNICANTFLIAEEPVHMTCTHLFCKDCWERYLNVKIQEGDAHHITCPAYDCTMLVPVDIIEGIVSRDMALRYLQFDIKAFVDSNPDMKWCPYPGCGRAVKLPDLDQGTGQANKRGKIPSDTSRGVDCGVGHYFCWECLEESHEPCSCENWRKWFQKIADVKPEMLDGTEQETEVAANCLWLVTNSKPCPNCKSPIQKNEGCNHMKCSKCKYDFCWVCLEQWKRHNSSTGGYFKCNRYEVLKKVEEHSAQLVSEAESKNKNMQELNRFVHYYTRFKNHENSYKLEEPLLKTAKDKMMKLAEAVTDNATAHAETKFVEDAVQQLLKARRVLKCSYVYGYYLDGPGYKKIVFEFMQTELEECTEILSQMVNRLYLRTPRRKIIEQAHIVQRKRLEFIMAISKGLVPPETPPSVRKGKKKRKYSGGGTEDEDLHRAIVASIQEIDPNNPWIKDASGRHTNVVALLEWPSDESEESDGEPEPKAAREKIGKCRRPGCNKVRAKNPRTNKHHVYCSRSCMLMDKEEENRDEGDGLSEIVLDEHMELLRALEMSRLQYLRDSGLLHVPNSQQKCRKNKQELRSQPVELPAMTKSTQTRGQRHKHRPRSNSAGQESKSKTRTSGISSMEELGIELQRFQELSSAFPRGEREDGSSDTKNSNAKASSHRRKLSQSSRFDEYKSTIVTRVPNKSVEDLYCLDQTQKSNKLSHGHSQGLLAEVSGSLSNSLFENGGATASVPADTSLAGGFYCGNEKITDVSSAATGGQSPAGGLGLIGSMFGAIKDISVSNIHSNEMDKTKDFLSKDLASIFAAWDSEETRVMTSSPCEVQSSAVQAFARRPLTLEDGSPSSGKGHSGKSTTGKSLVKSAKTKTKASGSGESSRENLKSLASQGSSSGICREESKSEDDKTWTWLSGGSFESPAATEDRPSASEDKSQAKSRCKPGGGNVPPECGVEDKNSRDSGEISLLEMAENLLQMTADVHSRMREVEKGIRGLDMASTAENNKGEMSGVVEGTKTGSGEAVTPGVAVEREDVGQWCESVSKDKNPSHNTTSTADPASNSEKILFRLPKTAWSLDEKEDDPSTRISSSVSKSSRKSSSQKTKIYDSEGSRSKSSRKSSSRSRKSKEAVAVTLICDADGRAHEVPSTRRRRDRTHSSPRHVHNIDANQAFSSTNDPSASVSEPSLSASDSTMSGSVTETAGDDCASFVNDKTENLVTGSRSSQDLTTNRTESTASSMFSSSAYMTLSAPKTADPQLPFSQSASVSKEQESSTKVDGFENSIDYCLRRNISYDQYDNSTPGSQQGRKTQEISSRESGDGIALAMDSCADNEQDNNNVVATSALITDAYETAVSDDNWEDASSVLPTDNQLAEERGQVENMEDDDDDDDDLDSVYV